TLKPIDFSPPLGHVPNAIVWLTALNIDRGQHIQIRGSANEDRNGFTISIDTWGDSKLYKGGAS
ncbi:hypothetical protein P167DRAFT_477087, partial [Morchella conica CCBAS932]